MHELSRPQHWLPRLLFLWAMLALATLAVMLTHRSDNTMFLGRYSPAIMGMVGLLAATTLAGLGAGAILGQRPSLLARLDASLLEFRQNRYRRGAVLILSGMALGAIWLLVLGNHLPTYAMLRLFLGATIALTALGILYGGDTTDSSANWSPLAWGGAALLVLIALATVSFYPAMYHTDEALIFSMGRNLLETGHNGTPIYRHSYPLDDGRGGLWTWGLAAWLEIFGLSFTAGRLHFLVLGLVMVGLTAWTVRQMYGKTSALFTVIPGIFVATALNFLRYDMPCALWLALALVFFSVGQRRDGWWWHLLTGAAAGLCVDSAPIGSCFGLGFALFYLWQYIGYVRSTRRWLWLPFWGLIAGGLAALLIYALTRAGTSYPSSSGSTLSMLSRYVTIISDSLATGRFLEMARQFLTTWLTSQPLFFGLVVLGTVTALRKRTVFDRLLLVLLVTWTTVMIFAFHYFPVLYLVHSLPITLALAARALTDGVPWLLNAAPLHVTGAPHQAGIGYCHPATYLAAGSHRRQPHDTIFSRRCDRRRAGNRTVGSRGCGHRRCRTLLFWYVESSQLRRRGH